MPSQRLLKLLDPLGHVTTRPPPDVKVAVIWCPTGALSLALQARLAAAGFHPLVASAFHQVLASVLPESSPRAKLLVVDADALSSFQLAALTSLRWGGFEGPIVAINRRGELDARTRTLLSVDVVVPRSARLTRLHEILPALRRE